MTEAEWNEVARTAHMRLVSAGYQTYYTDRAGNTRSTTDLIAPGAYAFYQRTLVGGAESVLPRADVIPEPPRVMPLQASPGSSITLGTIPISAPQPTVALTMPVVSAALPAFTSIVGGPVPPRITDLGPPPQRAGEPPFNFSTAKPTIEQVIDRAPTVTNQPRVTTRGPDREAIGREGGMSARSELLSRASRGDRASALSFDFAPSGGGGVGFPSGIGAVGGLVDLINALSPTAAAAITAIFGPRGSTTRMPAIPRVPGGLAPAATGGECECKKKRRRRGITAGQLTGFHRVVSLLRRVGMQPRHLSVTRRKKVCK